SRTPAQSIVQELGQACDAGLVLDADRRHLDDLPANELDPVVLIEDSGFAHPVVVVHREPPPDYLAVRRHALILRAPGAGASTPNVGYTGQRMPDGSASRPCGGYGSSAAIGM